MSRPWLPLLRAWLVSIVATGSAVFIGEVMGNHRLPIETAETAKAHRG